MTIEQGATSSAWRIMAAAYLLTYRSRPANPRWRSCSRCCTRAANSAAGDIRVSGGLHGVGASVVNALSEWLEVEVCKDGKRYGMKFSRGDIVEHIKVLGDAQGSGTTVRFKPDPEMFDDTVYDYEILHTRMREQAFLNAGLTIILRDEREGWSRARSFAMRAAYANSCPISTTTKTPYMRTSSISAAPRATPWQRWRCNTTTATARRL